MNGHISHLCFWQPQCFLEFRTEPSMGLIVHRKGLGLVLAHCLSHKEPFWSSITPGLGSRGWVGSSPLYWLHHPGQYTVGCFGIWTTRTSTWHEGMLLQVGIRTHHPKKLCCKPSLKKHKKAPTINSSTCVSPRREARKPFPWPVLTCPISQNHLIGSECFSSHTQYSKEPEDTLLIETNTPPPRLEWGWADKGACK